MSLVVLPPVVTVRVLWPNPTERPPVVGTPTATATLPADASPEDVEAVRAALARLR